MPPALREDQHRARSQRHQLIGNALGDAGDEWAVVPWFYSAYHLVKAALLRDPIWGDLQSLHAISVDLTPDDRFIDRHKGRRGRVPGVAVEFGINDLVLRLYRPAAGSYDRLHTASNLVRYGIGLSDGALESLRGCLDQIMDMDSRGELEAPLLHTKGSPEG